MPREWRSIEQSLNLLMTMMHDEHISFLLFSILFYYILEQKKNKTTIQKQEKNLN